MKKFKIGIVGCGRIASVYLDAFQKMKDVVDVFGATDKVLQRA